MEPPGSPDRPWIAETFLSVIMQPTTLCNLDCGYCYLPTRRQRNEMSVEVATAVAQSIAEQDADLPVSVVWHGGEPLATPHGKFKELLAPFEALRMEGKVQHYLQTNATLVNERWCELFRAFEVRVGVSVDGMEAHTQARVDWRGRAAFARIEQGIDCLREAGIPFSLIAVVTASNIHDVRPMLAYLEATGARSIGFNIEEIEGTNKTATVPDVDEARSFWRSVIDWTRSDSSHARFREVARLAQYLNVARSGDAERWAAVQQDPIPTVSWSGDVTLLSPELAGFSDDARGTFSAGNVNDRSLVDIVKNCRDLWYVRDYEQGVARCQTECDFYEFCLGGHASNKYFEKGDLVTTETHHCRVSKQALVTAMLDIAKG